MDALNLEQCKLVEDNHNLIYALLHKNGWTVEKYYDVAAIGLCKAAMRYNPERGTKFSTYAMTVMRNEVLQDKRRGRAKKRSGFAEVPFEDYMDVEGGIDPYEIVREKEILDFFQESDLFCIE